MAEPSDPRTLAFYDAEAEAYAARGDRSNVSGSLGAFLAAWVAASAPWSDVEIGETGGSGYDGKPTEWLFLQAVRNT